MPEFHYHASDANGQLIQGVLCADDKNHLVRDLQAQGLFLVSYTSDVPGPTPAVLANKASPHPVSLFEMPSSGQLATKQKLLLGLMIASGFFVGIFRVYLKRHPAEPATQLNEKLSRIRTGMTRQDVDAVFTTPYSSQGASDHPRYFVPPHFVVQLAFDSKNVTDTDHQRLLRIQSITTVENGAIPPAKT